MTIQKIVQLQRCWFTKNKFLPIFGYATKIYCTRL